MNNDIAGCILAEAEDLGAAAGTHCHAYKKAAVVIIVCYGAVMGIRAMKLVLSNAVRNFKSVADTINYFVYK